MALRSVAASLDPLTLAEWRSGISAWVGVDYNTLSTDAQTELNRYIDEEHDYIYKRFGDQRWAQRVWTLGGGDFSSPSTSDGTFELPIDLRQVIAIQEGENGTGARGRLVTYKQFLDAGADLTSHNWDQQEEPRYFYKAMSDDNPPVETWQRQPVPQSALTAMTIVGRGYFTLLGTSGDAQYTELPPQVVPIIRERVRAKWAGFTGNTEKQQLHKTLAESEAAVTMINDAPDGSEDLIYPDNGSDFYNELFRGDK